jgi:hygromycin-B 4-O-kinase
MPDSIDVLLSFLRSHFSPTAAQLTFLSSGWFSQAYAFSADGSEYILRLNAWQVDFQKDAYAAAHLAGPDLPIPPMLRLDRFDAQRFYAITPRCPGRGMNELDAAAQLRLLPQLFDALADLHQRSTADLPGWGLTGADFRGGFASWPAYVLSLHNHKFHYTLESLEGTFFEPDFYRAVLAEVERLLPFLPAQKSIVHGDFGWHNLVSDGERLTGVLDWAEARLGDPLYDVVNLEYWSPEIPFCELWRAYAARHAIAEPNFDERRRCYILAGAAGDLRLSAHRGDFEDYCFARAKAVPLI